MVVVADTSPLNYLVQIGEAEVLCALYGKVLVPEAVIAELRHVRSPFDVANFACSPPAWLEIVSALNKREAIPGLDAGESAAIALAGLYPGSLLLIDETDGRNEAARRGIPTTGTLGVLRDASAMGIVDLPSALARLQSTTFRVAPELVRLLLEQDRILRG